MRTISLFVWSVIFLNAPLFSYNSAPPCYRQIQTTFFNRDVVAQALALHNIDQNLWIFIVRDLNEAARNVPSTLNSQARALRPNPLAHPFDPTKALQLLESSLYAIYFPVINSYRYKVSNSNINDDVIFRSFRYIWMQQLAYLQRCMGG